VTEPDLGPLVELLQQVEVGALDMDTAKAAASEHGARGEAKPQVLVGMTEAALNASSTAWRLPLRGTELAYAAACAAHQARPDDRAAAESLLFVGAALVEILHVALMEHGDIRLYLRAMEVGSQTSAAAADLGFPRLQGLVEFRLGTLLLDIYSAGRTPSNHEGEFRSWVAKALQTNDPDLLTLVSHQIGPDGEPDPERAPPSWPAPLDGLEMAEKHLQTALPLLIPERRGRALKALAQLIEWRGLIGGPEDKDRLRSVIDQALAELPPDASQPRLALLAMLRRLGDVPGNESLISELENDWDGFLARVGEQDAWDTVGQAATAVQEAEPERALRLLRLRRRLAGPWADDNRRARHFGDELLLFGQAYGPSWVKSAWSEDLNELAGRAFTLALSATTPETAREAAAAIVTIMLACTARSSNKEALALRLMGELGELDATLWSDCDDALACLGASMWRGEGVNLMNAGDFTEAGRHYQEAARRYQQAGLATPMVECLGYLDDVVTAGTKDPDALTAWLVAYSLEMELAALAAAPAAIQRLATHLLGVRLAAGTSTEVMQLLLQVIKGRRFAATMVAGTRDFRLDDYTRHLLELEAQAEARLPEDSDILRPAPFDDAIGEDEIISAWADEYETGPSETPEDVLANMQRSVERRMTALLVPSSASPPVPLSEIKRHLDPGTALLILFEGVWPDGTMVMGQLLITRNFERGALGREALPGGSYRFSWPGRSISMSPSGLFVAHIRRSVQADPGPLDVSAEGEEELTSASDRYTRVLYECRDRLIADGIEQIVVVPHGPSRYAPIHLAGPPGRPLAGDWKVSYLANLAQLTADTTGTARSGIGVFGLSYADQPRLPRLDDSAAEVRVIAEVCGVAPHLDEAATEPAFSRALETCRYLHLRAHGRLYADAPGFHTVFLHPSDGHDGRLRAYEVLQLDLVGLELVTLGACETALGRTDYSDNPRGLPAALLLAGAGAVIGTLWPVLAAASTCFFTELYRVLMSGDEGVSSAFAASQRVTRERFPQYRDWGAFYLIGGLRRRPTA